MPAVVPPDSRVQVTEDTRDYDLIGVTLPEAPATPVYVRPGHDDGTWGEWTALEFGDAATPPAEPLPGVDVPQEPDETSPGAHSEPYWVGDASSYQLDLTAAQAEVAQVHLVYETTRQVAVAETAPAGADPAHPVVWDATPGGPGRRRSRPARPTSSWRSSTTR